MFLLIIFIAFGASLLTLFSGFGLGTILLPVFALFFPLPVAIGATAVVHLSNNIFKIFLVGKKADLKTVVRFAVPASIAAVLGALLLKTIENIKPLTQYSIGDKQFELTAISVTIGILIIVFALFELLPQFKKFSFKSQYIPVGGLLSGFFGGISGLQGALRSAFLINAGLSKEQFVGTTVVSAVVVDMSRLLVYGIAFYSSQFGAIDSSILPVLISAIAAAFIGAYAGKRLLKKVSIGAIQKIVGTMLIIIGVLLTAGII